MPAIISGRDDEATPVAVRPFFDLIPDARWRIFDASGHLPHVEGTQRYLDVVQSFLDGAEPDGADPV